jgi:hypothetical protein
MPRVGHKLARADRRTKDPHDPAHYRPGDRRLSLDPPEVLLASIADALELGLHPPPALGNEADRDLLLSHGGKDSLIYVS